MKMTVVFVAAVAAGLSFAVAAPGGVKVFAPPQGSSGYWDVTTNWSPQGVPSSSDRVIIPEGLECRIRDDNRVADTLQIEADRSDPDPFNHQIGRLVIESCRLLTLYNATNNDGVPGPDHSLIDGELLLEDGGCNGFSLLFACPGGQIPTCPSHVVWGEGAIIGESSDRCGIQVAAGVTLVNQLAEPGRGIRGAMTILGAIAPGYANGTFRNEGLVEAAKGVEDNVFILASSTILADTPGASWKVGEPDDFYLKKMIFDREATNLKGNFVAHGCAELAAFVFNASVRTCGWHVRTRDALMWCPGIDVNNGATFSYIAFLTSADPDEACANPGTSPGPGLFPCTNHYVVDSDVDFGPCGD